MPANTTILIDASIIGQSIIPYLDTANFYDIAYNSYVTCANVSHDKERILNALKNLDKTYSGKYIIICNHFVPLDPSYSELIFETKNSMINENIFIVLHILIKRVLKFKALSFIFDYFFLLFHNLLNLIHNLLYVALLLYLI